MTRCAGGVLRPGMVARSLLAVLCACFSVMADLQPVAATPTVSYRLYVDESGAAQRERRSRRPPLTRRHQTWSW